MGSNGPQAYSGSSVLDVLPVKSELAWGIATLAQLRLLHKSVVSRHYPASLSLVMFFSSLFFLFAGSVSALRLPVQRRSPTTRSATVVVSNPNGISSTGFTDVGNGLYTATIYLQGEPFQVQIDSGSSDLWINTMGYDLQGLTNTGENSTTSYGDGSVAEGPIVLGNITLGEFTVAGQALVTAPGSNATTAGADQGLLGIGLPMGSSIYQDLNGTSSNGLPFLQNVFSGLPDESKFVTLLLSRGALGDSEYAEGGALTIGEIVSNYTGILETPKLPVFSSEGWITLLDGLTVNGVFHPGNSSGISPNEFGLPVQPAENQSLALLDSGTSLALVPRYYVDAMYKDLPGAVFLEEGGYYQVPCETKVNISMVFSSISYPVHPLDSVIVDNVNTTGAVRCRGAFSALEDPLWTLGDTFMRNIYTLYYHGNAFLTDDNSTTPYIQILGITDADAAYAAYDELNARRIAEDEYETFASLYNVTSSMPLAAEPTYTYSLVDITAVPVSTTGSASTASVGGAVAEASASVTSAAH
ncbi:acid protease [Daedalea quercina L-15889]|uniref:Acid protease n=1 Tax=Daedalea quercina L-15889 TaxID=1314783 RepID=A0A165TLA1_9APHY|nr:acid protease [Daedalea quercina L-15889]